MSYWIKHFVDARNETGKDLDLAVGKASWPRGRLEGMVSATLSYAGTVIKVWALNPGNEIWQKDQFTVGIGSPCLPPARVARSLGLKITEHEVGKLAYLHPEGHDIFSLVFEEGEVDGNCIEVQEDDVGRWFVLKISRVGTVGLLVKEKYRV